MSKFEQISRYLAKVYPSQRAFEEKLAGSEILTIYLGIDPTSPNIHLGNTISLRVLRQFQDWGHQVVLIFGDFTGNIGDPSGHDKARKPLESKQLLKNASHYKDQVSRILDFENNPPQIVFNSKWWSKIKLTDFFEILSTFTLSQLIERDLFQQRIKNNRPIAISEFLYPILQGYDSVELDTDIEIGGNDQTFNMLIGRQMQKRYKNKEKLVLSTPILEGTDGRKMSKSYGNTIDLSTAPNDMFGKIMSINDNLIVKYMLLTTTIPMEKIEKVESELKSSKINPMTAKRGLAFTMVNQYHGENRAKEAQVEFERVFQKGGVPKPTPHSVKKSRIPISELLVDSALASSKSEAKRLVEQGGVRIGSKKIEDSSEIVTLKPGTIVRVGKLKSIQIT